jgi:hypothetical protein
MQPTKICLSGFSEVFVTPCPYPQNSDIICWVTAMSVESPASCNANRSAHLKNFVWLSGVRWAIEQCFEEAKSDLGMDHYEVREIAS